MTTTTVLIVDDHQMFGDALELLLSGHDDIHVLPVMRDAEGALDLAGSHCPDVVLMDIDLPGMDGIEATRRLTEMCVDSGVVMITALVDPDLIGRAVSAGATGFVSKQRAADELVQTIKLTAAGETVFLPHELEAIAGRMPDRSADRLTTPLTPRELEVLQAIANGMTTEEIAAAFVVSPRTVQGHVQNILTKLGVRSKLEAVLYGLRTGQVRLGPVGEPGLRR
jgi:DNA-binding NarL/FixJ family response regulator